MIPATRRNQWRLPSSSKRQSNSTKSVRLAYLADILETGEMSHPRYAWDNPLGLVLGGQTDAKLV